MKPRRRWFRFGLKEIVPLFALCAWAASGQSPPSDNQDAKPRHIVPTMQGTWVVSQSEAFGHIFKQDVGKKVVIEGDKITLGRAIIRFEVDATKTPMQIDMFATKGGGATHQRGIVAVDKGTLKICYANNRPKSFQEKDGYLWVLVKPQP